MSKGIEKLRSIGEIYDFLCPKNEKGSNEIRPIVNWRGRKFTCNNEEFKLNDLVKQLRKVAKPGLDIETKQKGHQIIAKINFLDRKGEKVLESKNFLFRIATFFRRLFDKLVFNRKKILEKISEKFGAVIKEQQPLQKKSSDDAQLLEKKDSTLEKNNHSQEKIASAEKQQKSEEPKTPKPKPRKNQDNTRTFSKFGVIKRIQSSQPETSTSEDMLSLLEEISKEESKQTHAQELSKADQEEKKQPAQELKQEAHQQDLPKLAKVVTNEPSQEFKQTAATPLNSKPFEPPKQEVIVKPTIQEPKQNTPPPIIANSQPQIPAAQLSQVIIKQPPQEPKSNTPPPAIVNQQPQIPLPQVAQEVIAKQPPQVPKPNTPPPVFANQQPPVQTQSTQADITKQQPQEPKQNPSPSVVANQQPQVSLQTTQEVTVKPIILPESKPRLKRTESVPVITAKPKATPPQKRLKPEQNQNASVQENIAKPNDSPKPKETIPPVAVQQPAKSATPIVERKNPEPVTNVITPVKVIQQQDANTLPSQSGKQAIAQPQSEDIFNKIERSLEDDLKSLAEEEFFLLNKSDLDQNITSLPVNQKAENKVTNEIPKPAAQPIPKQDIKPEKPQEQKRTPTGSLTKQQQIDNRRSRSPERTDDKNRKRESTPMPPMPKDGSFNSKAGGLLDKAGSFIKNLRTQSPTGKESGKPTNSNTSKVPSKNIQTLGAKVSGSIRFKTPETQNIRAQVRRQETFKKQDLNLQANTNKEEEPIQNPNQNAQKTEKLKSPQTEKLKSSQTNTNKEEEPIQNPNQNVQKTEKLKSPPKAVSKKTKKATLRPKERKELLAKMENAAAKIKELS